MYKKISVEQLQLNKLIAGKDFRLFKNVICAF